MKFDIQTVFVYIFSENYETLAIVSWMTLKQCDSFRGTAFFVALKMIESVTSVRGRVLEKV